jgi:hypothetical protein
VGSLIRILSFAVILGAGCRSRDSGTALADEVDSGVISGGGDGAALEIWCRSAPLNGEVIEFYRQMIHVGMDATLKSVHQDPSEIPWLDDVPIRQQTNVISPTKASLVYNNHQGNRGFELTVSLDLNDPEIDRVLAPRWPELGGPALTDQAMLRKGKISDGTRNLANRDVVCWMYPEIVGG